MRKSIEQSRGHLGVAKDRSPLGEAEVGGDGQTGVLVELADQMEQQGAIRARQRSEAPCHLTDWDYLAGVSDETRMGALRLFSPDTQQFVDGDHLQAPPMTDLRKLEAITARVGRDNGDDTPERIEWLLHLAAPGSALGGARPKACLRDVDHSLWLAKFPSNDDRHDIGLWEYISYQLARRAGVGGILAAGVSLQMGEVGVGMRFSHSITLSEQRLLGAPDSPPFALSVARAAGGVEASTGAAKPSPVCASTSSLLKPVTVHGCSSRVVFSLRLEHAPDWIRWSTNSRTWPGSMDAGNHPGRHSRHPGAPGGSWLGGSAWTRPAAFTGSPPAMAAR